MIAATLVALVATPSIAAPGRLHVVLMIDTQIEGVDLQDAMKADLATVNGMFWQHLPTDTDQLVIHPLEGDKCRLDALEQLVRRTRFTADDALVVFYSGHGGYDLTDGEFVIFPRGKEVARADVARVIRSLDIRLGALIVNACANEIVGERQEPEDEQTYTSSQIRTGMAPLVDSLFFRERGFVELAAAKRGEEAKTSFRYGSPFLLAFEEVLQNRSSERLDWVDFTAAVQETAAGLARDLDEDHRQTALLLSDPRLVPRNKLTFGAEIKNAAGGTGCKIVRVLPGGRAAAAGLRSGDVLLSIDGSPISNYQVFRSLIANRRGRTVLRYRRAGGEQQVTIAW